MKITGLLFILMILMSILKYTNIFNFPTVWIIGVFCIWFISIYISIHMKNKEAMTPKPVYIQEPY